MSLPVQPIKSFCDCGHPVLEIELFDGDLQETSKLVRGVLKIIYEEQVPAKFYEIPYGEHYTTYKHLEKCEVTADLVSSILDVAGEEFERQRSSQIQEGYWVINATAIIEATKAAFAGRDIYFSPFQLPPGLEIRSEWQNFGIASSITPSFPLAWQTFSDELPWVTSLLDKCLLGTAILVGSSIELLYIFHDNNGLYYYIGGEPLSRSDNALIFGGRIADFYYTIHNGFTFYPAQSMGPQKIEDCVFVSDLIDEHDTDFAAKWLAVFSNGGGDYLAVDTINAANDNGLIWWHEQPLEPESGVVFFEIMDTWMSIFLEDTKQRGVIFET
ncbi:hypothetical protein [Pseudomonas amygdali]|uniref:hypothetical protein n=1 Tax=Pseudomonas amygdali TaxID=47877 RepID=UPI000E3D2044|nr:hypothetical protein [Pseudomonas amygdali]MDU8647338.1 hypothetical protein [Pseudomonas syringae group sp. 26L6]